MPSTVTIPETCAFRAAIRAMAASRETAPPKVSNMESTCLRAKRANRLRGNFAFKAEQKAFSPFAILKCDAVIKDPFLSFLM
jgi:hypothetical protein